MKGETVSIEDQIALIKARMPAVYGAIQAKAGEIVRIEGRVRVTEPALKAPLSGRACVHFDFQVEKQASKNRMERVIRETKSTLDKNLLRPTEKTKIECGIKHFKAIGIDGAVGDYEIAAPGHWNV
jgi:hypothetical protein